MRCRKTQTLTPITKALACGLLEDNGRVLFLVQKDVGNHRTSMIERIELPCVVVPSGRSPFAEIKDAFQRLTGIDGEVGEIVLEARHNAGSRKRKFWVPCLVFRITAKNRTTKPSTDFSGFRWLPFNEAKKQDNVKLGRNLEWLRRLR